MWNEEIFWPVVCVRHLYVEKEDVRSANASSFGLGAAVLSRELQRCQLVALLLRA
ncbi:aldehyde dehydrogenase family protein [Pseudomonas aeruginosa]